MTAARELDIVLFGATGFVGRLTARHLAEHAPAPVRIALAGRSRERLEAVRRDLPGAAADWPLVVLDALDEAAVADLAARTRVVVTTVGPYAKFGMPLAAACAEAGTHYCDLTGEVLFVHRSVARNHEAAMLSGARVVHACGFDSIPSDLGVMLCADAARADGAELGRTRLAVRSMKGGFSGGTIDSARTQALEMRADPETRRIAADPWALAEGGRPPRGPRLPARGGVAGVVDRATKASPVRRDPDNGHFTGPFVMAAFNTRVVARSASLLGYGDGFRYTEYSDYGAGPRGAVTASVVSAGLLGAVGGMAFAPTRAVLDRVLPAPGEGPSEEAMAGGRFRMEVTAEATNGARYRSVVAAPYDPGYSGTAVMLGQSALALAEDDAGLPDASGVLTPATGLGTPLVERLRAHRFTLEVERLS
ncbi:saccharopine dehydrogenase family protein [Phycicoccus jejuensis]|uniref:saccharopine dehydrogenase family protein n=1 Tax=Phycicoccus jejuensis TaxID=367299 RepID=UPI0004C46680|nr:saccharopine dehydrogenase NADP-binding domain-containing protein [Phycicoccus jejuensis]